MLRLSSLIVFTSVLVMISSPILAQDYDFEAEGLQVRQVGSLYDVSPVINLSVAGTFPAEVVIEYQLFVNDVLVGSNSDHTVSLNTTCADLPTSCSGACTVLIHGEKFAGTCSGTLADCYCSGKYKLWKLPDVAIPEGATCRLVLDPNNLVSEIDETNNTYTVRGLNHPIPTTSEWWAIAMGLMLLVGGTIVFFRKRAREVAA